MKYVIQLTKTLSVTEVIEADTYVAAFLAAKEKHKGYDADTVVRINDDEEPVEEHHLETACENCGRLIWDAEKYYSDAEGNNFCPTCWEAFTKSNTQVSNAPVTGASPEDKSNE